MAALAASSIYCTGCYGLVFAGACGESLGDGMWMLRCVVRLTVCGRAMAPPFWTMDANCLELWTSAGLGEHPRSGLPRGSILWVWFRRRRRHRTAYAASCGQAAVCCTPSFCGRVYRSGDAQKSHNMGPSRPYLCQLHAICTTRISTLWIFRAYNFHGRGGRKRP